MRKVYLFTFAILSISGLKAQVNSWQQPEDWILSTPGNYTNEQVKGRPELFEEYMDAVIFMKRGDKIDDIKINLFNLDDLVVSKPYKGVEALYDIDENEITHFEVNMADGRIRTFLRKDKSLFAGNFGQSGFYERMTDHGLFLKRSYKEFKKAEKAGGYALGSSDDEYILVQRYFLSPDGVKEYKEFKLSKKSISKALGDKAAQARVLMKKNGWKWNNESHVLLLMEKLQLP